MGPSSWATDHQRRCPAKTNVIFASLSVLRRAYRNSLPPPLPPVATAASERSAAATPAPRSTAQPWRRQHAFERTEEETHVLRRRAITPSDRRAKRCPANGPRPAPISDVVLVEQRAADLGVGRALGYAHRRERVGPVGRVDDELQPHRLQPRVQRRGVPPVPLVPRLQPLLLGPPPGPDADRRSSRSAPCGDSRACRPRPAST